VTITDATITDVTITDASVTNLSNTDTNVSDWYCNSGPVQVPVGESAAYPAFPSAPRDQFLLARCPHFAYLPDIFLTLHSCRTFSGRMKRFICPGAM
jgi:hypothetical protein